MEKKPFFDLRPGRLIRVLMAHATLILSAMVITWFIIDRFNTAMEFMSSDLSKWFIGILAFLTFISSIITIAVLWYDPDGEKKRAEKREKKEPEE